MDSGISLVLILDLSLSISINTREIPESIFGEILQFDSWEILEPSSEEIPNTCSIPDICSGEIPNTNSGEFP